mmetsp:Transcript_59268/g.176103  ORF Transcript_59268/g.176103 Transcript_59268/m.176103 type:complete len:230 (-) Transcript_59268:2102-2791(-)|eukprot:CAMPEP_0113562580 /NCGR_PEP_ID=MMETSP0015_2-20120614/20603_1 /TAXON_ID=2838 /ORGANISM="Odontella" /LENGTH=229 /DNA_ID=CAMNT_0000464487 /DNA_START=308 /DNA_END=997 /DNA_ORIENTATION=+ /assembly_acc=CAM_ASM_000160
MAHSYHKPNSFHSTNERPKMAQLVLTLAQNMDGMPAEAVDATKRATIATLDSMLPPLDSMNQGEEKKDDSHASLRPNQVHLLVAAPKRMIGDARGIDRPDWERQWSYGEVLFGDMVRTIGLQRFSPNCSTQLVANLVDVGNVGGATQTERELALLRDIAKQCLSKLRHKDCLSVGRTTIVLPVNASEFEESESRRGQLQETVKAAFSQVWREEQGPLQDTNFEFVTVDA